MIAGQAAPGAKVELLRDGQPLDTVVADASGQFVMTPPKLPAGSYELTLRAKAPDGTVTQSSRTMPVTIAEAAPPPARVAPAARQERRRPKPDDKSDVVASLPASRAWHRAERSASAEHDGQRRNPGSWRGRRRGCDGRVGVARGRPQHDTGGGRRQPGDLPRRQPVGAAAVSLTATAPATR